MPDNFSDMIKSVLYWLFSDLGLMWVDNTYLSILTTKELISKYFSEIFRMYPNIKWMNILNNVFQTIYFWSVPITDVIYSLTCVEKRNRWKNSIKSLLLTFAGWLGFWHLKWQCFHSSYTEKNGCGCKILLSALYWISDGKNVLLLLFFFECLTLNQPFIPKTALFVGKFSVYCCHCIIKSLIVEAKKKPRKKLPAFKYIFFPFIFFGFAEKKSWWHEKQREKFFAYSFLSHQSVFRP